MVYCLLFYSYIDQRMGGLLHCDVSLHSVWYSLCQSLLYIIIFHHNDIIQSNDGKLILLINYYYYYFRSCFFKTAQFGSNNFIKIQPTEGYRCSTH